MNKRKRIILVALVVTLGLAGYFANRYRLVNADDGLLASGAVEATEAQLGFQVPGRIETLVVREGDRVEAGQELARLDTRETEARLAQARAQVATVTVRLADTRRDLERNKTLLSGGAIGQETFDKSQLAFSVAGSELAQAQANVRAIEAMLANMVIRASFGGVVTVRHREPGEIIPAGAPALTVMNPDNRWVRIYIPEQRIGAVHLGQQAAIVTDTWPDRHFGGEVMYISSQAEFTPKNVQTTEERVKLVYAVKVRVSDDPKFELKPGMPADVRLVSLAP